MKVISIEIILYSFITLFDHDLILNIWSLIKIEINIRK